MLFISKLVRRFREAIADKALAYTYSVYAEAEDYWTKEDSERTSAYFYGSTGEKLQARLTNYAMRSAVAATRNPSDLSYHNGVARGIILGIRAIEDHIPDRPLRKRDTLGNDALSSEAVVPALR